MFRLSVAIALSLISITACGRSATPPAAPATPAKEASAPAQPAAATPAVPQTAESEQATASQETTSETTSDDRGDAALEHLAAMPADQQLPGGKWKAGTNYTPLVPAQPTNVGPGKVEVVEVFWFGCPHCNALEPFIQSWLKNKPEYVELVRVPVMWGPVHRAHAKLFYMLRALNRTDLDQKVFDTIHKDGNMLVANDEQATRKMQLDFLKANGVSAEDFNKAWDSFTVSTGLQRAEQLTERYKVNGVPLIVINGKYTTDVGMAGGPGQLLQLINDLAASEKQRR
ncbi:MAG: thiol:disulfide interchange protein DsbA/DsbL [Gammaproteobacteria bacterium]